jgi:hypothetical protein
MRPLFFALVFACSAWAALAGNITGRLVRAENTNAPPDRAVQDIAEKLRKVFGYTHYEQLGHDTRPFQAGQKVKLDLGEGFTVFCHPKGINRDGKYEMDVELYSGKTLIVKPERLAIRPGKYVLVRGPEVGATIFIVALTVAP